VTSRQVEVDKADKALVEQAAVTEVYIHGWKVDDVMMGILGECFPVVTSLHTADLWNVGLNDVTLAKLAGIVCRCRALRSLLLDGNPVSAQRWHLLIQVYPLQVYHTRRESKQEQKRVVVAPGNAHCVYISRVSLRAAGAGTGQCVVAQPLGLLLRPRCYCSAAAAAAIRQFTD